MIRLVTVVFSILLVLSFQWTNAQSNIPAGSYQKSCGNYKTNGPNLEAECDPGYSGEWIRTTLRNFAECSTDIVNFYGRLTCVKNTLPQGTYQKSCIGGYLDSGNLIAVCRTSGGNWYKSVLNRFMDCVYTNTDTIWNAEGRLACRKSNSPLGSYLFSCTEIAVNAGILSAVCSNKKGNWQPTSLNINCNGDISNEDGNLNCNDSAPTDTRTYEFCLEIGTPSDTGGLNYRYQQWLGYGSSKDEAYRNAQARVSFTDIPCLGLYCQVLPNPCK
jgi:hypothetical protein